MYLTATEWTYVYGGRRPEQDLEDEIRQKFKRIPFDHCALSLQPFENPYCNVDGYAFELEHVLPFVQKFGKDPVSGNAITAKDLIKLNYQKNQEGVYHCPVLYKPFTENSHIVAIKVTGNVFSYEAVEELNIKTKNYRDLLNDEPFTRKDIITLQDPLAVDRQNAAEFYHFKNKLRWQEEEDQDDPNYRLNKMNSVTKATLEELDNSKEKYAGASSSNSDIKSTPKLDIYNAANYSTGRAAASLTSTVMEPQTRTEAAVLTDDVIKYQKVNKKGYCQIMTSLGPLNFELYCDQVPKACDNFLRLCRNGYYDNTVFHRLIKNFMLQGGDPLGTGTGGQSVFGEPFEDEFRQHLSHTGRGVLSMANSGPNTNKSQFFITFRSCKHLDKKHTVFGRLVGGLETLDKIEKSATDAKDRPLEPISITKSIIYVDPFQDILDNIAQERKKLEAAEQAAASAKAKPKTASSGPLRSGVGAFIDLSTLTDKQAAGTSQLNSPGQSSKKDKTSSTTVSKFGSFSGW